MAEKKQVPVKKSRVLEILRTEYPFERVLLGVLGAFVTILGVYLIQGDLLNITLTDWWIFDSPTKRLIFAIFVTVIGAVSIVMAIWPFFTPSFAEMKKVTWPGRTTILNHSARVFGFILFLSFFFITINFPLKWLMTLLRDLAS